MRRFVSLGVSAALGIAAALSVAADFRLTEADVYEAALAPYANDSSVVVSLASTCRIDSDLAPKGIDPSLLSRFLRANLAGMPSTDLAELREYFAIADADQLAAYMRAGVPTSALIGGDRHLVRLSRVGFNQDETEAIFCIQALRSNALMHLQLIGGTWQHINTIRL
ncbi:MAG: hypothetical protein IPK97_16735 [Ahniella sp.]|nr:hypothetical protein [Ahniella sp.]